MHLYVYMIAWMHTFCFHFFVCLLHTNLRLHKAKREKKTKKTKKKNIDRFKWQLTVWNFQKYKARKSGNKNSNAVIG